MRFVGLVWANLARKKLRTTLTVGSFAVALFLFGVLVPIRGAFSGGTDVAGADRLTVINKTSLIMPLPFSYRDRLLGVPGVAAVTFATWFGGVYQDERNFFPQFAVDKDTWFDVYSEYVVPKERLAEFLRDRQGCLVGRSLAKRFGWKVGDRIPLRGAIFTGAWEFNLDGIYDGKRPDVDTSQMLFRYDYLEEQRQFGKGTVGWYVVKLANPDDAVRVAAAIDDGFANSPYETLTQTEKAFAASFAKQMGNIGLLVMTIGAVVFFTLLLVTGNTMAIAVRERTGELAVLKTVGFSDLGVLGLVLGESVLIAGQGGALGLALAKLFTLGGDPTRGMLASFYLPWSSIGLGFGLALLVGAAAGALPAISAMRLGVVDALRRV
ncbi:MAG: FtsX-like permease family protein [Thermoanaerobaculaceae bacterium]|nr:FtsX-like permease family protein [Thermoanaerobaculaceae bacterium]TAM47672.1 MAG: FtsX-like permease family protein [Acidobacteriota bacterium]